MKCSNCGVHLGCGCQKRAAKDGKACCTKCVDAYNSTLGASPKSPQSKGVAPIINKVEYRK